MGISIGRVSLAPVHDENTRGIGAVNASGGTYTTKVSPHLVDLGKSASFPYVSFSELVQNDKVVTVDSR